MTTLSGRDQVAIRTSHSETPVRTVAAGGRSFLQAAALGVLLAGPSLGLGGVRIYSEWSQRDRARVAIAERHQAHHKLLAAPAGPMLDVQRASQGRTLFESACAACHKPDGTGVPGLGKDLTTSWFIASLTDAELIKFVEAGRPITDPENTTKVPMLPKGGRADLTSEDLRHIVLYVRGLQDTRRMPALPIAAAPPLLPVTADEKAQALQAAGGDAELAEYIAHGSKVYVSTCIACHGKDGVGMQGNGKPLATSEFVKGLSDDDLLAFIKRGRDPSDPKNTTRVGMPAKGGNPALTDDDLLDVIAYLRSLQKSTIHR